MVTRWQVWRARARWSHGVYEAHEAHRALEAYVVHEVHRAHRYTSHLGVHKDCLICTKTNQEIDMSFRGYCFG